MNIKTFDNVYIYEENANYFKGALVFLITIPFLILIGFIIYFSYIYSFYLLFTALILFIFYYLALSKIVKSSKKPNCEIDIDAKKLYYSNGKIEKTFDINYNSFHIKEYHPYPRGYGYSGLGANTKYEYYFTDGNNRKYIFFDISKELKDEIKKIIGI